VAWIQKEGAVQTLWTVEQRRLTRRWSERRTAVRSAFDMTSTLSLI
jgi:hypothetical protein